MKIVSRILLAVLLVGAVVAFVVLRGRASTAGAKGAKPAASAERVVPVATATVQKKDVPILLDGLGTVTPIAMVTVRSQVDGRLNQVVFKEGQTVKKGTLLAQVDARPFTIQLHQAEAALVRDEAQLKNGKLNLDRYKTLREQNLIAQQQYDDQVALVAQSDAAVLADRAQADNARLQLDYARIVSPIDGVTGVRMVDAGNLVRAADTGGIVVVTQIDPISVIFTLPQDDLGTVAASLAKGPLQVEALSREGDQVLATGELAVIDNQVNTQTSTIRLRATLPNPKRVLWPNAFVKARLHVATRNGALVVPSAAIQRGPQGTFVYVVGEGSTVALRPVTVERSEGDSTLVQKGVEPGEVVVTDGQNQLRPGAKVSTKSPEAPRTLSSGGAP